MTSSRPILRGIALAAVAMLALVPAAEAKPKKKKGPAPPNVVLIVTDDQTLEMFDRRAMPQTIDRLVRQGTQFTNFIATTPLCCPSRASMLTGQYGHNNGVLDNRYRQLVGKHNILPHWLRKAGYVTAHVGRYMNGYERGGRHRTTPGPGWDQWHSLIRPRRYYDYSLSVNGGSQPFGSNPEDYLTTVLNQRSVQLIKRFGKRPKPFYLQLDHFAPHTQGGSRDFCQSAAVPGPRDEDAFANESLPRPPSFNEEDVSDKPSFIRALPTLDADRIETMKRRYRCALASLLEVDRGVAQIDRALKQSGQQRNTVLIFTSDNGFYYGEHRLASSKNYPYEEALRLPLVIRAPKNALRGATPPRRVHAPVANIDLAPTILSFAGAISCKKPPRNRCRTMDGRSLMPLLRGKTDRYPERRTLMVELGRGRGVAADQDGSGTCAYAGLRTPTHLYIQHTFARDPNQGGICAPIDEREMYDLIADPYQLESQAVQPGSGLEPSIMQRELELRLEQLRDCAGIRGRDKRDGGRRFCE